MNTEKDMSTLDHQKEEKNESVRKARGMRFAIVAAQWNREITQALWEGARDTLIECGAREEDICTSWVAGSFELIYGAARYVKKHQVDAVIILGSVVRGETPHFDYICSGVTQGIARLNVEGDIPVIFGLLTTNDMEQARERAGGALGNKGSECALTAIDMVTEFER